MRVSFSLVPFTKIFLWLLCLLFLLYLITLTSVFGTRLSGDATQLLVSRVFLLVSLVVLVQKFILRNNSTTFLYEWLSEKQLPYSLAAVRIIIFLLPAIYALMPGSDFSNDILKEWIDLPLSQRRGIPFMEWYALSIPANRDIMTWVGPIFKVVSVFACIGFLTRFSTAIYVLLAFYIYSIPELYGNISNGHHKLWFPAILAVSQCGDALSVDNLIKKYFLRRTTERVLKSVKYALPLKAAAVLLGIIYFFPGFWKIWSCGLDWIFRQEMVNAMHSKWWQWNGWQPFFRIDKYPVIIIALSVFTIIFEIGFIFFQFENNWRKWLVASGFIFHRGTKIFMGINFFGLMPFYSVMINWNYFFYPKTSHPIPEEDNSKFSSIGFTIIVTVLLAGNIICGFTKIVSWPLACYPTFDYKYPAKVDVIIYEGYKDGAVKQHPFVKALLIQERTEYNLASLEQLLINSYQKDTHNTVSKNFEYLKYSPRLKEELDSVTVYLFQKDLKAVEEEDYSSKVKIAGVKMEGRN